MQCASRPERYIVTFVDIRNKLFCGFGAYGASFIETMPTNYHKTGKKYPQVAGLISSMIRSENEPESEEEEEHA